MKIFFIDNDRTRRSIAASAGRNIAQMGYSLLRRFNSDCYLHVFLDSYASVRPIAPVRRYRLERSIRRRYENRLKQIRKKGGSESEYRPMPMVTPALEDLPVVKSLPEKPSRAQLLDWLANGLLLKSAHSSAQCDVYAVRTGNDAYALAKTVVRGGFLARLAIPHEYQVLARLADCGLKFAPAPLAQYGNHTVVMQFMDHTAPLLGKRHYSAETKPGLEFFNALEEDIRKIHAAGIAHGDMRRANILIHQDGSPRIVDWTTSNLSNSWWSRLLFPLQEHSDTYSLYSIIRSYYPEAKEDEWKRVLDSMPWFLKAARWIRRTVYSRFLKKIIAH